MQLSSYSVRLPGIVYSGSGALSQISELAKGHRKAVLFTDQGIQSAGLTSKPVALLEQAGVTVEVIGNLPAEPTAEQAQTAVEACGACGADWIIAVGGGSVMDAAKLASVCAPGVCTVRQLLKDPSLAKKQIPTLMIPTTAGTGSEATPNSIVAVPEEALKVGIVNGAMIADSIILDAEMIRGLPRPIAAATGVDALCHAIECFTGNKANPLSDLFAMQALELIFANLEAACNDSGAMQAKEAMLLASFYAGVAISAAGTTAVHALAYPLGGKYHIAHGVSNAMLLAPVMRFNEDAVRPRLAQICDRVHPMQNADETEKSAWVIAKLCYFVKTLDIPAKLTGFGVPAEDLEVLVENGMKVTRLLSNNVKLLTADDARAIYSQLF